MPNVRSWSRHATAVASSSNVPTVSQPSKRGSPTATAGSLAAPPLARKRGIGTSVQPRRSGALVRRRRRRVPAGRGEQRQQRLARGAAEHAQAVQSVAVFVGVSPAWHDRRRALVPGGLHLADHARVVVTRGVAEPVDRYVEATLDRPAGAGDLFA